MKCIITKFSIERYIFLFISFYFSPNYSSEIHQYCIYIIVFNTMLQDNASIQKICRNPIPGDTSTKKTSPPQSDFPTTLSSHTTHTKKTKKQEYSTAKRSEFSSRMKCSKLPLRNNTKETTRRKYNTTKRNQDDGPWSISIPLNTWKTEQMPLSINYSLGLWRFCAWNGFFWMVLEYLFVLCRGD